MDISDLKRGLKILKNRFEIKIIRANDTNSLDLNLNSCGHFGPKNKD